MPNTSNDKEPINSNNTPVGASVPKGHEKELPVTSLGEALGRGLIEGAKAFIGVLSGGRKPDMKQEVSVSGTDEVHEYSRFEQGMAAQVGAVSSAPLASAANNGKASIVDHGARWVSYHGHNFKLGDASKAAIQLNGLGALTVRRMCTIPVLFSVADKIDQKLDDFPGKPVVTGFGLGAFEAVFASYFDWKENNAIRFEKRISYGHFYRALAPLAMRNGASCLPIASLVNDSSWPEAFLFATAGGVISTPFDYWAAVILTSPQNQPVFTAIKEAYKTGQNIQDVGGVVVIPSSQKLDKIPLKWDYVFRQSFRGASGRVGLAFSTCIGGIIAQYCEEGLHNCLLWGHGVLDKIEKKYPNLRPIDSTTWDLGDTESNMETNQNNDQDIKTDRIQTKKWAKAIEDEKLIQTIMSSDVVSGY